MEGIFSRLDFDQKTKMAPIHDVISIAYPLMRNTAISKISPKLKKKFQKQGVNGGRIKLVADPQTLVEMLYELDAYDNTHRAKTLSESLIQTLGVEGDFIEEIDEHSNKIAEARHLKMNLIMYINSLDIMSDDEFTAESRKQQMGTIKELVNELDELVQTI